MLRGFERKMCEFKGYSPKDMSAVVNNGDIARSEYELMERELLQNLSSHTHSPFAISARRETTTRGPQDLHAASDTQCRARRRRL
jgi:hypothetical protein